MHVPNVFAAATLVGTALLLGGPAKAQDESAPRETVRFDLDVSNAAGARAALTRIRGAVARVCGPEPDLTAWTERRLRRACVDRSLREAVAAVASPSLDTVAGVRTSTGAYDLARADTAAPRAVAR